MSASVLVLRASRHLRGHHHSRLDRRNRLIDTRHGTIAAKVISRSLGISDCAAKGTGRISEGLLSLVEGRAGAGAGLQLRRRRGQAAPLHVRAGSRVRQAEEVRDHAQMWRLFLLRKGSWTSSSSKASTRACASSSPSLARAPTVTRSSGTRISSNGRTSRKFFKRHRRLPCKLGPGCCGISGWAEPLVDDEMRVGAAHFSATPRGVVSPR